ncbi:MAG: hypothetical protein ACYC5O_24575 [Anaerolineae bacterium]
MITVRPSELLCAVCAAGGCSSPAAGAERVQEIVGEMKKDRFSKVRLEADVYVTLAHYLDVYEGRDPQALPEDFEARRSAFATRLRDLSALRHLGLQPGDERCAFDLARLLFRSVESLEGICYFDCESAQGWEECPHAHAGYYERGRRGPVSAEEAAANPTRAYNPVSVFVASRSEEEMLEAKRVSVEAIERADHLYIRPAHLMCIACYYGSGKEEPLADDNLYEIRLKMEREPDIPVTLTEGNCMVCDPCPLLIPETNLCLHSHVRNPLRDLLLFRKLGLKPGDTLPAREMYRLLFERVRTAPEICAWGDGKEVTKEWLSCGGAVSGNYEKAIERNLLGAAQG